MFTITHLSSDQSAPGGVNRTPWSVPQSRAAVVFLVTRETGQRPDARALDGVERGSGKLTIPYRNDHSRAIEITRA